MNENLGLDLEKILLAKELSSIIVNEIQEKGGNRNETKFEKEIRDIMNIVQGKIND
jgi:hypothetical protein